MDLTTITNRVKNTVVDVSTELDALIESAIQDAQRKAEDRHDFVAMRFEVTTYTATGTNRLVAKVPVGFKNFRQNAPPYWVDKSGGTNKMKGFTTLGDATSDYSMLDTTDVGIPNWLLWDESAATVGTNRGDFVVFPYPDENTTAGSLYGGTEYQIRIPYIGRLAALGTGLASENWFTYEAFEYLIAQACADSFLFNRDRAESAIWQAKADDLLRRSVVRDKRTQFTTTSLIVKRDVNETPHTAKGWS
jgi:hypothetical protein